MGFVLCHWCIVVLFVPCLTTNVGICWEIRRSVSTLFLRLRDLIVLLFSLWFSLFSFSSSFWFWPRRLFNCFDHAGFPPFSFYRANGYA